MGTYVKINGKEFADFIESQMKFHEIKIPGVFERTWEFDIDDRFALRVYSTISTDDNISRSVGADAIRCMVFDKKTQQITRLESRVHRTKNAFTNMRERCRELYKHIKHNRCVCGGVLVERSGRNGKFLGCSTYPACKHTKNITD